MSAMTPIFKHPEGCLVFGILSFLSGRRPYVLWRIEIRLCIPVNNIECHIAPVSFTYAQCFTKAWNLNQEKNELIKPYYKWKYQQLIETNHE